MYVFIYFPDVAVILHQGDLLFFILLVSWTGFLVRRCPSVPSAMWMEVVVVGKEGKSWRVFHF